MSGGQWNSNSYPAAGAAAVASKSRANASGPDILRCRTLTVSVSGDGTHAAPANRFVLRNGPSGTGAVLWEAVLAAPATGSSSIFLSGLDYRSSIGNALTLECTAPGNTAQASCSMAGDTVPNSYPAYSTSGGQ